MKAGELCTRKVVTVGPDESVIVAARRMVQHDVGTLVVVDEAGTTVRPIGIITDRDLVVRALAHGEPLGAVARDVMNASMVTAREDDDVDGVLAELRQRAIRRMPIVDRAGALVGILSLDDIVGWISDQLRDAATLIDRQSRGLPR